MGKSSAAELLDVAETEKTKRQSKGRVYPKVDDGLVSVKFANGDTTSLDVHPDLAGKLAVVGLASLISSAINKASGADAAKDLVSKLAESINSGKMPTVGRTSNKAPDLFIQAAANVFGKDVSKVEAWYANLNRKQKLAARKDSRIVEELARISPPDEDASKENVFSSLFDGE